MPFFSQILRKSHKEPDPFPALSRLLFFGFSALPPSSRHPICTPDPKAETGSEKPVGQVKENRSAPACGASCTDPSSLPAGPAARRHPTLKNARSALFLVAVQADLTVDGDGFRRAQNDIVTDFLNRSV